MRVVEIVGIVGIVDTTGLQWYSQAAERVKLVGLDHSYWHENF